MDEVTISQIRAKLIWSTHGPWSVPLSPEECKVLLELLRWTEVRTGTTTGTVDVRLTTNYCVGDPGDEQDE